MAADERARRLRRFSDQHLCDMVAEGVGVADIARRFGVARQSVYERLQLLNIRPRATAADSTIAAIVDTQDAEARQAAETFLRCYWRVRKPGSAAHFQRKAAGFCYFVRAATGEVKIGVSRDFGKRFTVLDAGIPCGLEVLFLVESERAGELEAAFHRQFATKRVKGEWFALDEDDLREVERQLDAL